MQLISVSVKVQVIHFDKKWIFKRRIFRINKYFFRSTIFTNIKNGKCGDAALYIAKKNKPQILVVRNIYQKIYKNMLRKICDKIKSCFLSYFHKL